MKRVSCHNSVLGAGSRVDADCTGAAERFLLGRDGRIYAMCRLCFARSPLAQWSRELSRQAYLDLLLAEEVMSS